MSKNRKSHKEPDYKIIDTGNSSQSINVRLNRILKQIPIGKTLVFHDLNQILEGKILIQIIDPIDIPPDYEIKKTKHSYKVIETKDSSDTRNTNRKE